MLNVIITVGLLSSIHSTGRVECNDKFVPIKRVSGSDLFTGIAYTIRFENPRNSLVCGKFFGNIDSSFPLELDAPSCKCPNGRSVAQDRIFQFVIIDEGDGCYSIKGVGRTSCKSENSTAAWALGFGVTSANTPILLDLGEINTSFKFEKGWKAGTHFIQVNYMNTTKWMTAKRIDNEVTVSEKKSEFSKTVWEPVSSFVGCQIVDIGYHEDAEILDAQTEQKVLRRQTYINNSVREGVHKIKLKASHFESHLFRLPLAFNIIENLQIQEGLPFLGSLTFPQNFTTEIGTIPNFLVGMKYELDIDEHPKIEAKTRVTATAGLYLTKGVEVPVTLMMKFSLEVTRLMNLRCHGFKSYGCVEISQALTPPEFVLHYLELNNITGRIIDVEGYSVILEVEASVRATFVSHTFVDIEEQRLL